jgi:hypothetical protein
MNAAGPASSWITEKVMRSGDRRDPGGLLVARERISRDEVVAVQGGQVLTTAQLLALPDLVSLGIQITDDLHLADLDVGDECNVMQYLRHSCDPNVGFSGGTVLVAMRDIATGDELTIDYALFDDHDGSMACTCLSRSCRKVIHGRDWMLPELQRKYCGYFSWYLELRIRSRS